MAKKTKVIPQEETKAHRFRRVVEPRVRKALKAIRLVGSVTGSSYEYDDSQIGTIITALHEEVDKTERSFEGMGDGRDSFRL